MCIRDRPWIEQLGSEKTAIQTIGNMSFINTKWLNFLGLSMPTTVDEFEQDVYKRQPYRRCDSSAMALRCGS